MSQISALLGLAVAACASAWQCPVGWGGPEECQQSNFGSCYDDDVMLGKGDVCTDQGATLSTFNHRQYGSGHMYRGCGVATGYEGDCCNCWRFRAESAAMLESNLSASEATGTNTGDEAPVNASDNLSGPAHSPDLPPPQMRNASTQAEEATQASSSVAAANSTRDEAPMAASFSLRGAALAECVPADAACGWNGQQRQSCCGSATCRPLLGNVGGKMVCVGGEQCVARGQVCGGPGQRDRRCCAGTCEGGPYAEKRCQDSCVALWQVCGGPGQRDQRCCHGHCKGGPYEKKHCRLL